MASDFIWRGAEEARQAIADRQLQAALAENESRERIAREQTAQQRYATQSQISEREKDRAVSREGIAAQYGVRANAEAEKRGNIQYSTILGSINNVGNPPTKGELEAMLAASLMSDDLKKDLRAERDRAYNAAIANYTSGTQAAKNYKSRLDALKLTSNIKAIEALVTKISNDPNVFFDAATDTVTSKYKMPREDAPGAAIIGPVTTIGEHERKAAATNQPAYRAQPLPTTAAERQALIDQAFREARAQAAAQTTSAPSHVPVAGAVRLSDMVSPVDTSQPYGEQLYGREIYGPPNRGTTHIPVAGPVRVADMVPSGPIGPPNNDIGFDRDYLADINPPLYGPPNRVRRSTAIAPPPSELYGPPNAARMFSGMPGVRPSDPTETDELIGFMHHPNFRRLAPEDQAWVFDEVSKAQRAYDLQTIRPEFRPPIDDYYAPR